MWWLVHILSDQINRDTSARNDSTTGDNEMILSDFPTNETLTSQIPALRLLINLGYKFLTPGEALRERQGRTSNVLFENILRDQLKEINRI